MSAERQPSQRCTPREVQEGSPIHLGLCGQNIQHSRSPILQRTNAHMCGYPLKYSLFDEAESAFVERVTSVETSTKLLGLNVTTPFKEVAFNLCDDRTDVAERAGAINTLAWSDQGKLIGHNTDVEGVSVLLSHTPLPPSPNTALILGAGAASRAAAIAVLQRGVSSLIWVSRSPQGGREIIEWTRNQSRDIDVAWVSAQGDESIGSSAGVEVNKVDLVIAATPPLELERWLQLEHRLKNKLGAQLGLDPIGVFIDLNYGERTKGSYEWALQSERIWVDGARMLVAQGVASFQWWTGCQLDEAEVWSNMSTYWKT